ncbi:MAG: hypothetical protein KIS78_32160 [Labilithrix sp.]|nr:hypothetical protein [Labilithrix sp.]MCW5837093.1 hypothetical protein [Labilithrix sp.]
MTGKAKIEGLTNSWYGFAVFSAIYGVLMKGIGVFSIAGAVGGLLFSWFITFLIGRALVKKSSLTRLVLVFTSGLLTVLGTLSVGRMAWMFVQTWQFGVLASMAYATVGVWMQARSFRTLMDGSVKAYIG